MLQKDYKNIKLICFLTKSIEIKSGFWYKYNSNNK